MIFSLLLLVWSHQVVTFRELHCLTGLHCIFNIILESLKRSISLILIEVTRVKAKFTNLSHFLSYFHVCILSHLICSFPLIVFQSHEMIISNFLPSLWLFSGERIDDLFILPCYIVLCKNFFEVRWIHFLDAMFGWACSILGLSSL